MALTLREYNAFCDRGVRARLSSWHFVQGIRHRVGSSARCARVQAGAVSCFTRDEVGSELRRAGAEQGGVEGLPQGLAFTGRGGAVEEAASGAGALGAWARSRSAGRGLGFVSFVRPSWLRLAAMPKAVSPGRRRESRGSEGIRSAAHASCLKRTGFPLSRETRPWRPLPCGACSSKLARPALALRAFAARIDPLDQFVR